MYNDILICTHIYIYIKREREREREIVIIIVSTVWIQILISRENEQKCQKIIWHKIMCQKMMCQPGPAAAVHARWPHIAELAGVHMWYTYTCMTYVYQPTNMGFQLTAPGFAKRLDVLNKT